MQKNKMVFVYGLILLAAVVVVLVVGSMTGPIHDENEAEGQTLIDEKQNSIRRLEENIATMKKQIDSITAEKDSLVLKSEEDEKTIEELRKKTTELEEQLKNQPIDTGSADAVTMAQAMSDMKDIYENFKSGNKSEARKAFEQIPTAGFDDSTLAYYEILKDVLGIN